MPRVKRRNKRRPSELPGHEVETLLRGIPKQRSDVGLRFMGDLDAQRRAWSASRDELLDWWISRYPGSRPSAWWLFDAPEPRRRVGGVEGDARKELWAEMKFQWPAQFDVPIQYRRGIPQPHLFNDEFESETDYLRRHGLLAAEEHATLGVEPMEGARCQA